MEVIYMCYECGCGSSITVMSDDSITKETFEKAANGSGITVEQAKKNTFELLKKELEEK
jgi:hypothetical protein